MSLACIAHTNLTEYRLSSLSLRFSASSRKALKTYVLQLVTDQLGRHNMPADNVSRNLLKFLITAVGFPELRLLVAQKIDSWIQNPKARN